jgi:hypothetical protein
MAPGPTQARLALTNERWSRPDPGTTPAPSPRRAQGREPTMDAPLDLYVELGVPRAAPAADITSAYHRLVRRFHPDTRPRPHSTRPLTSP